MSGYVIGDNNQLASDGTYNYAYDDEGNRISRTNISTGYVTTYTWDHRNRLTNVSEFDDEENILSTVGYSYDAFDSWVSRSHDEDGPGGVASNDTYFAYDEDQIAMEFTGDSGGDLSHVYSWGPLVDQLFADESFGEEPLWGLLDHLGTARDLIAHDEVTELRNHRFYDSFGTQVSQTSAIFVSLFGFTGRPLDSVTVLANHRARWYSSIAASWLSQDPTGFKSNDSNLQRYVENQPTSLIDFSGHAGGSAQLRPVPARATPPAQNSRPQARPSPTQPGSNRPPLRIYPPPSTPVLPGSTGSTPLRGPSPLAPSSPAPATGPSDAATLMPDSDRVWFVSERERRQAYGRQIDAALGELTRWAQSEGMSQRMAEQIARESRNPFSADETYDPVANARERLSARLVELRTAEVAALREVLELQRRRGNNDCTNYAFVARFGSFAGTPRFGDDGEEAHHLSQDIVFGTHMDGRPLIPRDEGLAVLLTGGVSIPGTQHYNVHQYMETWWESYRRGGPLFGERPTSMEYSVALYNSLLHAGFCTRTAFQMTVLSHLQRWQFGLGSQDRVPRIPGLLPGMQNHLIPNFQNPNTRRTN